jgi:hypothetical protein
MYDYDHRRAGGSSVRLLTEALRDATDSKSDSTARRKAKEVLYEALAKKSGPDACLDLLRAMKQANVSVPEALLMITTIV